MTTAEFYSSSPTEIDFARARAAIRRGVSPTALRAFRQLARASPTQRVGAIMTFLMLGIAIAVATTPNPLWWQLHFSELGTFSAFSSYVFNATLITAGASIVAFSRFLHRELSHHVVRSGSRRRSPIVVSLLIGSVGIHLAFVGLIPVNTWTFMHDRAATGMVFSFLVCLIVAPSMLRGIGRPLAAMTLPAAALLLGGGTTMVLGIINLAAFELIGFATMFTWMLLFVACLGRHAALSTRAQHTPVAVRAVECICAGDHAPHRRIRLRSTLDDRPPARHSGPAHNSPAHNGPAHNSPAHNGPAHSVHVGPARARGTIGSAPSRDPRAICDCVEPRHGTIALRYESLVPASAEPHSGLAPVRTLRRRAGSARSTLTSERNAEPMSAFAIAA